MVKKKRKRGRPRGTPTKIEWPKFDNDYFLQFKSRRIALIEWMAIPTFCEETKTSEEFAKLLRTSRKSLYRIKQKAGFENAVRARRKEFFKQYSSDILAAAAEQGLTGDAKSVKLFFQLVEDWEETTKQKTEITETRTLIAVVGIEKLRELQELAKTQRKLAPYIQHTKIIEDESK